jgi:hypothetical protein
MSWVARTIQSTAADVRLRTKRSCPRWSAVSVAPDQPSFGNGASGTPASPFRSRSWRTENVADPLAGRRDVARAVGTPVEVDDVRIGTIARQHDDERLARRRIGLDVDLAGGCR